MVSAPSVVVAGYVPPPSLVALARGMRPACLSRYGQPHVAVPPPKSSVTIRAIEDAWSKAFRRGNHFFPLAAIVVGSTILHWLAARRFGGLWILPDEGIYATRATDLWEHGILPLRHGQGGYGLLYPLLIGAPLSSGTVAQGYSALKLLQALAVSLAAVPVFILGRRLMADRYALVASVLTVSVPVLLYSGLVMTEVLFYPVAACALLAIAYTVSSGTIRSQLCAFAAILVAAATRPQAVVFVPVLAAAVLLDALCARDRSRLRAFWPTWLLVGGSVLALAAVPSLVGAYAGTLRGGYPLGAGLRLSAEHLSFAALACGLIPFAAVAVMSVRALRGLERDPAARAFISVCIASCLLLPLQVGFFAARYAPHLLGRNLAPLPPLLFLGFALWLSRGATRGRVTGPLVAFGVASLVLLVPWNALVVPTAFADTFDLLIVARVHGIAAVNVVMVVTLVMLAAFVFVPRRFAPALAVPVAVVLIAASAVAANEVARVVNAAQVALGPDRGWIDRAASSNVAYLYEGSEAWNLVWQERFWNRRVRRIYSIAPNRVPGSIAQTPVTVARLGALPIGENYVVAADRLSLVGTPVGHLAEPDLDIGGLTLWRLDGPARISMAKEGIQPNGDMSRTATITVYRCAGGQLELTLIPKATSVLHISLDGRPVLRRSIGGLGSWHGSIPVPAHRRRPNCTFRIVPTPLLGSTRIEFVRPA
jgi:hypothetical protein